MKAFLPIKNHSERVPGKNFLNLRGKPLFMWIVDTLLSCEEITQIIIDTDSNNDYIQDLRTNERILVKKRNPSLLGDDVSMNLLIQDLLADEIDSTFIMTHATNPFISTKTISAAIQVFREVTKVGYDSLLSVNKFKTRFYKENFEAINHDPRVLLKTQDLPCVYEENSCLYIFTKTSFENNHSNRIGKRPFLFTTPKFESLDIDTLEDWEYAKILSSHSPFKLNSRKVE